ncbi:hypothetical protein EON65_40140 [archaeon]|nr:MAG: hypothetical protein EON65_40140 [archaeon]
MVISLATKIVIMLFMQSIIYSLTSGGDGSCSHLQNETDCQGAPSAYNTGDRKCYWVSRSTAGNDDANLTPSSEGECFFLQPCQRSR